MFVINKNTYNENFNLEKYHENIPKVYKWWDYKDTIEENDKLQFNSEKEAISNLEIVLKNKLGSDGIKLIDSGGIPISNNSLKKT